MKAKYDATSNKQQATSNKQQATSNEQSTTDIICDHEITHWLSRAREGDEDAFGKLFDYYIGQLRLYLRNKLTKQDRAEGFEDDLAIESMASIWHGLTEGRFESVTNRDQFWFTMMCVAKSQALNRRKHLRCKKRMHGIADQSTSRCQLNVESNLASNEFEFLEVWEKFTKTLPNDEYRQIVHMKMEGMDANEIASQLHCESRSVRRKLEIVDRHWEAFVASQNYY